jgi:hypothetical protein
MLVYNVAIWNILQPFVTSFGRFGIFCGHLVIFSPLLVCCTEKNLATLYVPSRWKPRPLS